MQLGNFFAGHTADCACCGGHVSERIITEVEMWLAARAMGRLEGHIIRQEAGDPPYVEGEARLTSSLADNALRVADEVEEPILRALDETNPNHAAIIGAAAGAQSTWESRAWVPDVEREVREAVSATASVGTAQVPSAPNLSEFQRFRIVNGMSVAAKYYTNNYFSTQVMPSLVDAVGTAFTLDSPERNVALDNIRALLDRRLRSVPYWNVVANAAANRSYHYGLIMAGHTRGYGTVQFAAIMDDRTSEICASLNGTTWPIWQAVDLMERIAMAAPEDVKQVAPWMKPADISGFSSDELYRAGVMVPPLHGRCRSQIILVG